MALEDRFEVLRLLGEGSFGKVVEVRLRAGGGRFALKILGIGEDAARVRREIELATRVDHPHVLRCHEGGVDGTRAWLLMDLAEGSLEDRLRDPSRLAEAWELLRQAARGVAALHAAGLVHRDLKPENILLREGRAVVADLGLARGGDLRTLTATGTILGTPTYMAPEQASGEARVTRAADAWSLGVMFHEALEGQPPYPPDLSILEQVMRAAKGQVDPISRSRGRVAPRQLALVERCLRRDPAARPPDLAAFADELGPLEEVAGGEVEGTQVLEVDSAARPDGPLLTEERPLEGATAPLPGATAPLPSAPRTRELGSASAGPRGAAPPVGDPGRGAPAPPASAARRGVAVAGFVAIVAAAALYQGPGSPPREPVEGAAPAPVATRQLDEGLLAEIAADALAAREWYLFPKETELVRDSAASGSGARRALDDPLLWPALVGKLSGVREFHSRLLAGRIRPEDLTEEDRIPLRKLDAVFREAGQAPPFAPFLDLRPGPDEAELSPRDREQIAFFPFLLPANPTSPSVAIVPRTAAGWTREGIRHFVTFWDAIEARDRGLAERLARGDPRAVLRDLLAEAREGTDLVVTPDVQAWLLVSAPKNYQEVLSTLFQGRTQVLVRRVLQRLHLDAAVSLRAFLHCVARACAAGEPGARFLSILVRRLDYLDEGIWAIGPAYGELEVLAGGSLGGHPAAAYSRGEILDAINLVKAGLPAAFVASVDAGALIRAYRQGYVPGERSPGSFHSLIQLIRRAFASGRNGDLLDLYERARDELLGIHRDFYTASALFRIASVLFLEGVELPPEEAYRLHAAVLTAREYGDRLRFRRESDVPPAPEPEEVLAWLEARAAAAPPPLVPLPAEFPARVEMELRRMSRVVQARNGGFFELGEDDSAEGLPPGLDPDPVAWGAVLGMLGEVRRFHEWVTAGGRPEDLAPDVKAALRETDEAYRARGLPRPFHPWLYVAPAPEPQEIGPVIRARGAHLWRGLPDRYPGWLGAALRDFRVLNEMEAAVTARLLEATQDPVVAGEEKLPIFRSLAFTQDRSLAEVVEENFRIGAARPPLAEVLREGSELAERALHAAFRARAAAASEDEIRAASILLDVARRPVIPYLHSWIPGVPIEAYLAGGRERRALAAQAAHWMVRMQRAYEYACRREGDAGRAPTCASFLATRRRLLGVALEGQGEGLAVREDRELALELRLDLFSEVGDAGEFVDALGILARVLPDATEARRAALLRESFDAAEEVTRRGAAVPRERLGWLRDQAGACLARLEAAGTEAAAKVAAKLRGGLADYEDAFFRR